MVSTKYHTEKSEAKSGLVEDAEPGKGREEGEGETTGTHGQGPRGSQPR